MTGMAIVGSRVFGLLPSMKTAGGTERLVTRAQEQARWPRGNRTMATPEDCVAAKLSAEEQTDKDVIFVRQISGGQQTPMGTTPVPVKLSVEIAANANEVLIVCIVRT